MDSDWGACDYPVIAGHEIVGEVTEVGKDVKELKVGDRVGVGAMVTTHHTHKLQTRLMSRWMCVDDMLSCRVVGGCLSYMQLLQT